MIRCLSGTLGPHVNLLLALSCSDYNLQGSEDVEPGDPEETASPGAPALSVSPDSHDFGSLAIGAASDAAVTLKSIGDAPVTVTRFEWGGSTDLYYTPPAELPLTLDPGDTTIVVVSYEPTDEGDDEALLSVVSDDPDEPVQSVDLYGTVKPFEGFSTGWYVYDDGIAYETTSNSSYVVDHHGDTDLYWYEPSGAHGLLGSSDPDADFAVMRDYVIAAAGAPYPATEPFDYDASSSLATFEYATFTYFLCDFWLDAGEDPSRYTIASGSVDDGIQVMVNGSILGQLKLGQSGEWALDNADPGAVNTLIVILADDSASNKYIHDLGFYKDGVFVQ